MYLCGCLVLVSLSITTCLEFLLCYLYCFFFFLFFFICLFLFFFQAEDGIRDLVRSRGLGDVYKRQVHRSGKCHLWHSHAQIRLEHREELQTCNAITFRATRHRHRPCLLYTSDAADERSSVDLGGRRIIKKKTNNNTNNCLLYPQQTQTTVHMTESATATQEL